MTQWTVDKPFVLDLFCGVGGASMGISRAGFRVEGVDIHPQPDYPFDFHQADAIKWLEDILESGFDEFDAYFASPPCQAYSAANKQWRNKGYEYPDMVEVTRELLLATGKPFVLENVPRSPLRKDLELCMSMFDDGREFMVRRHRVFEIHGFEVPQPEHKKHHGGGRVGDGRIISVFGHGGGRRYNHASSKIDDWCVAMGIDWTRKRKSLAEAIPPAYTEYIFSYLTNV